MDLVEKYSLENVISLPKGAFSDASIKSNILIVKRKQNKSKNHIWYFDLLNDGFTLNKARKKIHGQNDIDVLLSETSLKIEDIDRLKKINFDILYKEKIKRNQYILLINQYKEQVIDNFAFHKISLEELEKCNDIKFLKGNGLSKTKIDGNGKYECILYGELYTLYDNLFIEKIHSKTDLKGKVLSQEGDVLIPATTTADADGIAIARTLCKSNVNIGSDINIIRIHNKSRINPQYLSLVLSYPLKSELAKYARGANILHLNIPDIKKIKIPIPTLEEQKNMVRLYQKKEREIADCKNKIKLLEIDMKTSIENAFLIDLLNVKG